MNFNYMHSKFKSDIPISMRATVKTNLSVKGNDPYASNIFFRAYYEVVQT